MLSNSQKNVATVFLFIIYPLATLPISLYWISKKKKKGFLLFSALLSLLTVVLAPYGDLYRYYLDYNQFASISLYRFIEDVRIDFIFYFYEWIFAYYDLNFEWIRMSLAFLMFNLLFSIFFKVTQTIDNGKKYLLLFISYMAICNWISYTNGFRSVYANTLMFYGIYKLFIEKKKMGYIYMLISVFIHISMLLPLLLTIMSTHINFSLRFRHIVIMLMVIFSFFFIDWTSLILTLEKLPFLTGRLLVYFDGYWATEFLEDRSIKGLIITYSYMLLILFPLFYYFIRTSEAIIRLYSLNSFLFIFMLPFINFQTIIMRYTFFVAVISFIYLLIVSPKTLLKNNIIILCFCYLILNFYSVRHRLVDSRLSLLATSSLYGIVQNQFDTRWCDEHLMDDGSLKIGYKMMKTNK